MLEYRGQHGFLKFRPFGAILTCDKHRQGSTQNFCGCATKHLQNSFITGSDVAFKIGGEDGNYSAAGTQGERSGCFGGDAACVIGGNWCP